MQNRCPIYRTADVIGKRWSILILLELYREGARPKRYSELQGSVSGISPKTLSLRLRELEGRGLVGNEVDASSVPIRSEYRLTEKGLSFMPILREIRRWALRWEDGVCENRSCKECGKSSEL